LRSTTTEIGRFQNELFQAQLRVARGGFIDALTEGLRELNQWFRSREGRDFFLSLGAALGSFVQVLATLPSWFSTISHFIKLFIGYKLAAVFMGWAGGARTVTGAFVTLGGALTAARAGLVTFTATLGTAIARMQFANATGMTLVATLRTIGALLMRIPALAVLTGAMWITTELIGNWLGGVNEVTSALDEHDRVMGRVLESYDKVKDKTDAWKRALEEVTADEVALSFRRKFDALQQQLEQFGSNTTVKFERLEGQAKELFDFRQAVRNGEMTIAGFISRVEAMYGDIKDENTRLFAEELLEGARKAKVFEDALGEIARVAADKGVAIEGLTTALHLYNTTQDKLTDSTDEGASAMDKATASANAYADALQRLLGLVPGIAAELKSLEAISEIERIFDEGVANLGNMRGARARYRNLVNARDRAIQAELLKNVSDSVRESVKLLVNKEGFRSTPYWDVNAYRIGFGSDTVTLSDGSIQKVVQGMSITQADAYRDLTRRIGEFQDGIIRKIGPAAFNAFTAEQQAALTSIAYNYGSLPDRVAKVINEGGSIKQIADAIRALGTDNDGVNRQRRADEADLFLGSQTGAQAYEWEKKKTDELKKQNEERAKEQEATAKQLADLGFQIEQQKLIMDGRGREAAIEEAIRQAKAANKNITQEQIEQVAELTGRLYDMQNAQAGVEAAEKRVNDLYQLRQELMQQIEYYQKQGEYGKADALKAQLVNVNSELERAIENAIAMWQAIGGPDADLAIAKLNTTKLALADLGTTAVISAEMIAERLTGALTNAFRAMAQAIAEGEDAWEAFSRAFLQGIAEMLIEIGQLIIKQMILNALQGFIGGLGGGGGFLAGLLRHEGGPVGAGGHHRAVSPAWFTGAVRLHEGGVAGLRPNEVPAILEKGEVVDPGDGSVFRKMFGGDQQPPSVKIVNTFDSADVVSEGLNSAVGEQTFLNVVRRNAGKVRQMLGQ
jgi:GH24 family phage-related lysozyme (muramidase)